MNNMSKYEKLLQKAINAPGNLRFADLCGLAELGGFVFDRSAGSHRIYKHGSGVMMNFQDVNGKAKPYQVKQLVDFIKHIKGE
jgi:hypothetical protein